MAKAPQWRILKHIAVTRIKVLNTINATAKKQVNLRVARALDQRDGYAGSRP